MANKQLPTGTTVTPTLADKLVLGDASDSWRLKDCLISALKTLLFGAAVAMDSVFSFKMVTIAADDATPDVSGGNVFTTSANTGATAITDLDGAVAGQPIILIGGSATNSSTIADSGVFSLSAAWTASVDETLVLICTGTGPNTFVELSRSTN
jgi:hypothetical protein